VIVTFGWIFTSILGLNIFMSFRASFWFVQCFFFWVEFGLQAPGEVSPNVETWGYDTALG
jgi:hypothetical protein